MLSHLHVKGLGKENMGRISPLISCNSETPSIHSKGEMMRARARGAATATAAPAREVGEARQERWMNEQEVVGFELLQSTLAKFVLIN